MSFDGPSLIVSFILSGVGFVLFSFGRKMERPPQVISGLALMIFPYFVSNLWLEAGIAAGIIGLMLFALNQGW